MSDRPNVVLGALLAAGATMGGLVVVSLLTLAREGAETVAATLIGAFSACVFFLFGLDHVPVASLAIVVFSLASAAGLLRTIRAVRREIRLIDALPLSRIASGSLGEQAAGAGIALYVLPSSRPAAFCVDLLRPRVVVTTALLERLEPEEQKAAVYHELAHARRREPLKCLLARLAARTFFWLPALGALLDRYLLVKELAADREAIVRTSRPALAGALAQVLAQPTPPGAVGMAEHAAARVDRLFEPAARLPRLFRPWQLILSALAAGTLALAVVFASTLGPEQSQQMWEMLSTMSPHGLPGMVAGLGLNVAALVTVSALARRVVRLRRRPRGFARP